MIWHDMTWYIPSNRTGARVSSPASWTVHSGSVQRSHNACIHSPLTPSLTHSSFTLPHFFFPSCGPWMRSYWPCSQSLTYYYMHTYHSHPLLPSLTFSPFIPLPHPPPCSCGQWMRSCWPCLSDKWPSPCPCSVDLAQALDRWLDKSTRKTLSPPFGY